MGTINVRIHWPVRVAAGAAAVAVGLAAFSFVRINSPQPPVLVHQSSFDLGPHEFGATAIGRVVLANEGSGELVVGPFKTSCSCAGVEVERDGQFHRIEELRIPARSRTEVLVRIAVGAKPGSYQQVQVVFASNDPARPEGDFEVLISQILGGVHSVPAAAIFGDSEQGASNVRDVFIYGNGAKSRKIESIRVSHPERFKVELVPPQSGVHEPQTHESAGQMIAVARVRPKAGWIGPLDGYFEVTVAGETRPPDRVDVIGQILGPYTCTPDTLSLPRFVAGKPSYQGELLIARRDGKPITVTADGLPNGITAKVEQDSNTAQSRVVVTCDPAVPPVDRSVRLRFQVQIGKDTPTQLEVPLVVTGRSP